MKPLESVSAQITDSLKVQKAQNEAKSQADKLLAALKAGKGEEAMKAANLSFGAQKTVTRASRCHCSNCVLNAAAAERQTLLCDR